MKHHPMLMRTSKHGCWVECYCGWLGRRWTTLTGAHGEFGQHLLKERSR